VRTRAYWRKDWALRFAGGHRSTNDAFLEREAEEKILHMGGGGSLLDFGCGAAELLAFYASRFDELVGVDFSATMLVQARQRLERQSAENVRLLEADDESVWRLLEGQTFDVITATEVVQYLDRAQLDSFIGNAARHLNEGGRIALFDILHPLLYRLAYLGAFSSHRTPWHALGASVLTIAKRLGRRLRGWPPDVVGFSYDPSYLARTADHFELTTQVVWSMFYEYRYHAILTKRTRAPS